MTDTHFQHRLAAATRALALIQAIDKIRDAHTDPAQMLNAITQLIYDTVKADLCLLLLRHRETAVDELKVTLQRGTLQSELEALTQPDALAQLTGRDQMHQFTGDELGRSADLHLVALPIILHGERRLGTLLLGRAHLPFQPDEIALLETAESHIDSAVLQGYTTYDLQQRAKELETIYYIDHIRDRGLPFDEMLNTVVGKLEEILAVEAAFLMLYDYAGEDLELRAISRTNLLDVAAHEQALRAVAHESLDAGRLIARRDVGDGMRAVMCLPLILNERIIGVMGAINRRGRDRFDAADRRLLSAIGSQIDTAIFESLEQKRLRRVLGRSVDKRVMAQILANPDVDFLQGERRTLTILYADIRGSTSLAEQTEPEQLVKFINAYLTRMTDVILAHEGTLDKFVGDEVMALFGVPFPQADHPLRAVRAALAMQAAHTDLLREWTAAGGLNAPIGIGIATGNAIVGEMGSVQRSDYTVIGQVANLGARICSAAQGGQVLVSPDTYALVAADVVANPVHGMTFKGIGELMTVYAVEGVKCAA